MKSYFEKTPREMRPMYKYKNLTEKASVDRLLQSSFVIRKHRIPKFMKLV